MFIKILTEHIEIAQRTYDLAPLIENGAHLIANSLNNNKKLMLCGNGGSAADSQHLAAEFIGRFVKDRRPLPAIALSTDTSVLTSISNDYSFGDIYSRQVQALGQPGDCLLGISTSGNSQNVLRALHLAKTLKLSTIGLLGCHGGVIKDWCDISIIVPSDVTARIQEMHILIGHTLCELVEHLLGVCK